MRVRLVLTIPGLLLAAFLVGGVAVGGGNDDMPPGDSPSGIAYGTPRQVCTLQNSEILESSGLAPSRRQVGVFWTHNDSGDAPRIFAFDEKGRDLASVKLEGTNPSDLEDMASFSRNGEHYLLLGDIGDNLRNRAECHLFMVREPDLGSPSVPISQTIRFTYDDGPHDCESVAVDGPAGVILLVTKIASFVCGVYQLPIPERTETQRLKAQRIGTITVPLATAMDVSADGRRAIVLTYGHAYEYCRDGQESWSDAFAKPSREIHMPTRIQGEAVCYGRDDRSLYLTSEKLPTPLFVVPPKE